MNRWRVSVAVCGGLLLHASHAKATATAQRAGTAGTVGMRVASTRDRDRNRDRNRVTVDAWLVARFHDVQLLDDSVALASTAVVPPVRVESARDGDAVDTLFATQLGIGRNLPAYRVGMRVRLGASSGSIANVSATVLARRFFRAPIRPISARPDSAWRYGWGYVLTTAAVNAKVGAATYRGWLLFPPPDSARRVVRPSAPPSR